MAKHNVAHEYLDWTKQKLDEIDATLVTLDSSVETLKSDARKKADAAIAQIRNARDSFKAKVDILRSDMAASKEVADDAYAPLKAEWAEVEVAIQHFLTVAGDQASVVTAVLAARTEAQRKSWQSSLHAIRASASEAIEQGRAEADVALHRLVVETEKAKVKLGQVSSVSDDAWKAINDGLQEAKSVYERTWKKVSEAVTRIR